MYWATSPACRTNTGEDPSCAIAPGKLADLVLLNADPTVDIRNAQAVEAVIKNGEIIDRAALRLPGNGL